MQDTEYLDKFAVSVNRFYVFLYFMNLSNFWVIEPYPSNNIDFLQLQILTKNNYFLFPTQRKYLMVILKVYVLRQDILSLC